MNPSDLEGRGFGPLPWRVAEDAVADFVGISGDFPERWVKVAPPGFAAAALFAVATDLLGELSDRSVIHGEQSFNWYRPILIGALHETSGTVTRVRERGGVHFITFHVEARVDDDVVLGGKSLFLVSGESIPGGQSDVERAEPPHSHRGDPAAGEVGASRADLVRYASATRDWNPVHWDHEAGVAAGFPGVVVHGLLQAAWALRAAAATRSGTRPFEAARIRFRNPLLPARPAAVSIEESAGTVDVVIADDDAEYLIATISLADE